MCSSGNGAVTPRTVYLLGTPSAPDQFILPTRDEAVAQALAFAKRQRLRAWFDQGNDSFILLGTFRNEGDGRGDEGQEGKDG